jgi:hypothetical protein
VPVVCDVQDAGSRAGRRRHGPGRRRRSLTSHHAEGRHRFEVPPFGVCATISAMTEITDDFMREQMTRTREYSLVLLKAGENHGQEGSRAIIWEHGRRNFQLRADGLLSIVCPVPDDTDLCGVGIFNASIDRTREIMQGDPAVVAGVMTFEVHPVRSFPGDALPA